MAAVRGVTPVPGARLSQRDAEAVVSRFRELHAREGELIPDVVVRDATPARSPLHHLFEWNDSVASHKYRLVQARYLIRSVRVLIESSPGETLAFRAFVHLDPPGTSYLEIENVLSDETKREQLLEKALAEAESWRARYQMLSELSEVFRAIETARRRRRRPTVHAPSPALPPT